MASFLLLHPPLLVPAAWAPCAAQLTAGGHRVAVPDLAERFTDSVPFYVGAGAMLVALAILASGRRMIDDADARMAADAAGQTPGEAVEERGLEGADGLESLGSGETAEDTPREPARS